MPFIATIDTGGIAQGIGSVVGAMERMEQQQQQAQMADAHVQMMRADTDIMHEIQASEPDPTRWMDQYRTKMTEKSQQLSAQFKFKDAQSTFTANMGSAIEQKVPDVWNKADQMLQNQGKSKAQQRVAAARTDDELIVALQGSMADPYFVKAFGGDTVAAETALRTSIVAQKIDMITKEASTLGPIQAKESAVAFSKRFKNNDGSWREQVSDADKAMVNTYETQAKGVLDGLNAGISDENLLGFKSSFLSTVITPNLQKDKAFIVSEIEKEATRVMEDKLDFSNSDNTGMNNQDQNKYLDYLDNFKQVIDSGVKPTELLESWKSKINSDIMNVNDNDQKRKALADGLNSMKQDPSFQYLLATKGEAYVSGMIAQVTEEGQKTVIWDKSVVGPAIDLATESVKQNMRNQLLSKYSGAAKKNSVDAGMTIIDDSIRRTLSGTDMKKGITDDMRAVMMGNAQMDLMAAGLLGEDDNPVKKINDLFLGGAKNIETDLKGVDDYEQSVAYGLKFGASASATTVNGAVTDKAVYARTTATMALISATIKDRSPTATFKSDGFKVMPGLDGNYMRITYNEGTSTGASASADRTIFAVPVETVVKSPFGDRKVMELKYYESTGMKSPKPDLNREIFTKQKFAEEKAKTGDPASIKVPQVGIK